MFPTPSEPLFCRRYSSSSHDVIDDYLAGLALVLLAWPFFQPAFGKRIGLHSVLRAASTTL
jgi:hypothetical protein